jgi:hypothetical protein
MDKELFIFRWFNKGVSLDRKLNSAVNADDYFSAVSDYYRVVGSFWGEVDEHFGSVRDMAEYLNSQFGLEVQVNPRTYDIELKTGVKREGLHLKACEGESINPLIRNLIETNKSYFARQDFSDCELTLESLLGIDSTVCQSNLFKGEAYEVLFFMANLKYAVEVGYEGDWYEKGLERMRKIGFLKGSAVEVSFEGEDSLDSSLKANLAGLGIDCDWDMPSEDDEDEFLLEGDLVSQYKQLVGKLANDLLEEGGERKIFGTNFGNILINVENILCRGDTWDDYFQQMVPLAQGNRDIVAITRNNQRNFYMEFLVDVINLYRENYCVKRVKELDKREWGVWFEREKFDRAYDAGRSFFWRVCENLGLEGFVYAPKVFPPFVFREELVSVQEQVQGIPIYQREFDLNSVVKSVALIHFLGDEMSRVWDTNIFDLSVKTEVEGIIGVVFGNDEELRRESGSLVEYLESRERRFKVPIHGALHPDNILFNGERYEFVDMDNIGRALPSLDLMKFLEDGRIGLDAGGVMQYLALYHGIVHELRRALVGKKARDYFDFEEGTEIIRNVFDGPNIHLLSDEQRRTYALHTVLPLCWAGWKLDGERAEMLRRRAVSNAREFGEERLAHVLNRRFNF